MKLFFLSLDEGFFSGKKESFGFSAPKQPALFIGSPDESHLLACLVAYPV